MAGMFDYINKAGSRETAPKRTNDEGVQVAQGGDAQKKAAIQRLKDKGVQPTAVNIAEEMAMGDGAAPAKPAGEPMVGRPVMGGAQPSPEMLQRMKAAQEARNREVLERAMAERRRMSGAR
jgi:hypothetical protein